jgi:hypothetical protein
MRFPANRIYWVLFIVFTGVALYSSSIILLHRPYSGSVHRATGGKLLPLRLTDYITGEQIELPNQAINFILYYNFSSPQNLQNVAYAGYLMHKAQPTNVNFVVITGSHNADFEEMRRSGALPFPLVVDSSFSIARQLRVPQDADRSFIVGKDGAFLFAPPNGAFSPEDMRELFERYTQGKITYGDGPPAAAELVGKPFPNIAVKEIHTGAKALLFEVAPPARSNYLVFTASCPACMIEGTLGRLKSEFQPDTVPVITSRVPEIELRHMAENFHITSPIYIAEGEIPGFENIYYDSGALEAPVLRIRTNPKGLVLNVEPIQ